MDLDLVLLLTPQDEREGVTRGAAGILTGRQESLMSQWAEKHFGNAHPSSMTGLWNRKMCLTWCLLHFHSIQNGGERGGSLLHPAPSLDLDLIPSTHSWKALKPSRSGSQT